MNLQDLTRESKRRFGNKLSQVYPTLRGIATDDAIALLSLPRQVIENIAKAASESPVKLPEECRIPIREYEHDLGPFEVIFRDPFCGEPVAWGFRIVNELKEGRFGMLADYVRPLRCECISEKDWAVITYELTPEKAVKAYGDLRIVEVGPRNGFRAATYGTTRFVAKRLDPTKAKLLAVAPAEVIKHDY